MNARPAIRHTIRPTIHPTIRCAIYTRKSTEEGLDQDFNSLDAQHDACASYVASQKHEGWKLVRNRYDDGGISGGTLERPGLQQLLGWCQTNANRSQLARIALDYAARS